MSFQGNSSHPQVVAPSSSDEAVAVSHSVDSNENNYGCIESMVQEAIDEVIAITPVHVDANKKAVKSQESIPAFAADSFPTLPPMPAAHAPPNNRNSSNLQQLVTMSDIFTLLRTAESESRLPPSKGSRLRHVLMEAENSNCGECCWMNVVFRILCELIPAPVYPCVKREEGDVPISQPPSWPVVQSNQFVQKSHNPAFKSEVTNATDCTSALTAGNVASAPMPVQTSQKALCKPCSQPNTKSSVTPNSNSHENDDAIAALLVMNMNPSPTETTETHKRKAATPPSDQPPSKTPTQSSAIYPHPFASKNPTLYRRTRCKAPNCPNFGNACPEHGHDIKVCKVDSCTNRAVKGGVCSKHGAKRPMCKVEGCTNQSKREGRCIKHGAVYGGCRREGCGNLARSGGLCRKHGAK